MTDEAAQFGAEQIIHLARLAQGAGGDWALTPAQWTALRFFSRANRFSRTPSAFSEFHATTRGTASQTVKSLVSMGLLERHRSDTDGRSARFEVTEAGHAALRDDPLEGLVAALEALPESARAQFTATLCDVAGRLAREREAPQFGTCDDCCHLEHDPQNGGGYCRCADAMLGAQELEALCVEFVPRGADGGN